MVMAACSSKLSCCRSCAVVNIVLLQFIVCCVSWLCLAGADFMLPMESTKLPSR